MDILSPPKRPTDLFDNIDAYLDQMRKYKDLKEIPDRLISYLWHYFRDVNTSKDTLKALAIFTADHTYRYAANIMLTDDYTKMYFSSVITKLWDTLQDRGIDTFYILDNTLRADRFNLTIQLFALSGVAVVTPHWVIDGYVKYRSILDQAKWALSFKNEAFQAHETITIDPMAWEQEYEVRDQIHEYIKHNRNIVYIEKDSSVNYLEKVIEIAKKSKYVSILRNQAPDNPNVIDLKTK